MLKGYVAKALEEYNEKHGTKYEVKDILKVNGDGCQDFIFYLTLTVKNGKEEYFQIKVVRHMDQTLEFPIVRPRVKGGLDIWWLLSSLHRFGSGSSFSFVLRLLSMLDTITSKLPSF